MRRKRLGSGRGVRCAHWPAAQSSERSCGSPYRDSRARGSRCRRLVCAGIRARGELQGFPQLLPAPDVTLWCVASRNRSGRARTCSCSGLVGQSGSAAWKCAGCKDPEDSCVQAVAHRRGAVAKALSGCGLPELRSGTVSPARPVEVCPCGQVGVALDDARWPAATAPVEEAVGTGGNALTVGEGHGAAVRSTSPIFSSAARASTTGRGCISTSITRTTRGCPASGRRPRAG